MPGPSFDTEDIYRILEEIAPEYNETFAQIIWQNKVKLSRSEHIVPTLTEVGLCFTFNALNSYEIYTEEYVVNL